MIKSIFKVIIFTLFISFVFGEFELMKKSRGYVEATDYLSLKIKGTNCVEFLKKGGFADRIRGGYSHHCLPINSKGEDVDDLKFIGRCLNHNKGVVLSILEIQRKREYSSRPKHGRPHGKAQLKDDGKKKAIRSFEGPSSHREEQDIQFYIRLSADEQPVEFKVKSFHLNKGHVYQARRPTCIKARNFCPSKKTSRENLMVIDCDRSKLAEGVIGKHETVYLEVTKRDEAPDTCVDKRNGYCCRYVNNEARGGICDFYNRRNGPNFGQGYGSDNQNDKKESSNIFPVQEEVKSDVANNDKKADEVAPTSSLSDSESLSPEEEEIEMEEVVEEDGAPLESVDKKTQEVATDSKKSDNKDNKTPVKPAKKADEETTEGEEVDEKSLTAADSKEKRKTNNRKTSNKKTANNNNEEIFNVDLSNNNDHKQNGSSSNDEFDIFEEDLDDSSTPSTSSSSDENNHVNNNTNDDDKKKNVVAAPVVQQI